MSSWRALNLNELILTTDNDTLRQCSMFFKYMYLLESTQQKTCRIIIVAASWNGKCGQQQGHYKRTLWKDIKSTEAMILPGRSYKNATAVNLLQCLSFLIEEGPSIQTSHRHWGKLAMVWKGTRDYDEEFFSCVEYNTSEWLWKQCNLMIFCVITCHVVAPAHLPEQAAMQETVALVLSINHMVTQN